MIFFFEIKRGKYDSRIVEIALFYVTIHFRRDESKPFACTLKYFVDNWFLFLLERERETI